MDPYDQDAPGRRKVAVKKIFGAPAAVLFCAAVLLAGCGKTAAPPGSSAPGTSPSDPQMFLAESGSPSSASPDSVIPNDAAGIPDEAFYRAILKTMREDGKTPVDENGDGLLQVREAQSVPYTVHWEKKGIRSVQGLELLSAFEIYLDGNRISDLSPVVKRAQKVQHGEGLICAELSDNRVTDLYSLTAPMLLSGRKGLQIDRLDLSDNQVSNVAPLGELRDTGIKSLNLSHNEIESADALLNGAMVEVLDLSYNRISKVGECSTGAFYLDLSHNRLETVGRLSGTFLSQVYLSDNRLTDLSFLKGAKAEGTSGTGLLCLDASDNRLSSLPDFKSWGWTNFSPKKEDGTYQVDFRGNRLTESELRAKLPAAFFAAHETNGDSGSDVVVDGAKWLSDQTRHQEAGA